MTFLTDEEPWPNNAVRGAVWTLVIALICYTLWRRAFVRLEYATIVLILVAGAGLFYDLKQALGRRDLTVQTLVTPVLFGLSVLSMYWLLFQAWSRGLATYYTPGSLLPYSDAAGYVNGASWLLTFGQLGEYAARRPMGTCVMAAALGAGNLNYQIALILMASLAGIATFFAARELWLAGGIAASLLYLAFCNLVMLQWLVTFMAETPAYTFASLSFACLLNGFRRQLFRWSLCGFGLLIVALSARPGAMFTIPFVGVYLIYVFSQNWRQALRKCVLALLVAVSVIGWSPLLVSRISPGGEYQGEFSYTLYGLAAGGRSWQYVFQEHPEIRQIPSEGERTRHVYSLFKERFLAAPVVFFSALGSAFVFAVQHPASVFFGLITVIPSEIPALLTLVALILLCPYALSRTEPLTFLFWIAPSVLLSAPFLFDAGWRVYMATFPFQLALSASAISLILRLIGRLRSRRQPNETGHDSTWWDWSALGFTTVLMSTVTLFPVLISMSSHAQVKSLISREGLGNWQDEIFFYNPGSGVLAGTGDRVLGVLSVPLASINSGDFGKDLKPYYHVRPGNFLCFGQFLRRPNAGVYILFDGVPDLRPGYLKVSVRLLEQGGGFSLYKVEAFARVDS